MTKCCCFTSSLSCQSNSAGNEINFLLKANNYYLEIWETITNEKVLVLKCITTNFNSKTFDTKASKNSLPTVQITNAHFCNNMSHTYLLLIVLLTK